MKTPRLFIHTFCLPLAAAICLGLFTPAASPAEQESAQQTEILRYRQQTGKAAHIYNWKLETQGENVLITLEEPDATFTNLCTPDGSTLSWTQLLPLWTGRAVNFVTSGSGWPFFHSPRGKSGMSHGLNRSKLAQRCFKGGVLRPACRCGCSPGS